MDHNCASCGKVRPGCGHKKHVGIGYCNDWSDKSVSSNEMVANEEMKK